MKKYFQKLFLISCIFLVSTTLLGCQNNEAEKKQAFDPQTYENDGLNFTVDFPSEYDLNEKSSNTMSTVLASNGTHTFSVVYVSIPASSISDSGTDFIEVMKNNELDALKAKNCVTKEINTDHSIGIEIQYDGTLADNAIKSQSQFLLYDDKFFQLSYKTKDEQIDQEFSNQFFNSFKLKE